MKKKTAEAIDAGQILEDAESLLAATAHIAEEQVASARKRLASAVESGKEMIENLKDKAIAGAKATDETIREHPYESIGVALGVGLLIGYLLGRRK
jgi:ElaB/YqjD/DUF883 family membrane-anchored ribosome-binding protein